MQIVRSNVKKLVEASGMKQSAIAERALIPEKQFSALICGRKIMRPEHIAQIAAELGVTPNDLFAVAPPYRYDPNGEFLPPPA